MTRPIGMNEAAEEELRHKLERDINEVIKRYPVLNGCCEVSKQNMAQMAADAIVDELIYVQSRETT